MAQIVEYNAPGAAIRPSTVGEQELQIEGRRAGQIGAEVGSMERQSGAEWDRGLKEAGAGVATVGKVVERHAAQQEITAGVTSLADTVDQLNDHYNQAVASADPFDPNVSSNWRRDVMDPALSAFQDQFSTPAGKAWAAEHVARVATDMYRHTVAADMERAQGQAQAAVTQTTNTLTNMVQRDPATLDMALGMIPGTLGALSKNANLSPELADKMQTSLSQHMQREVALSGLKGAIENNPAAGLRLAQSGKYDKIISGADVTQLESYARAMTRVRDIGVKGAAKADEENLAKQSAARATDYFGQIAGGAVTPDTAMQIVRDPQIQNDDKGALLQSLAAPPVQRSDPATMDALIGDLAGTGPRLKPADIMAVKGLTPADTHWLMQEAQQPSSPAMTALKNTLDQAKTNIAGPPMSRTPAGMAAYARFQQAAIAAARNGAPFDLTKSPDLLKHFQPQANDIVPPPAGPPKRSLRQVFSESDMYRAELNQR